MCIDFYHCCLLTQKCNMAQESQIAPFRHSKELTASVTSIQVFVSSAPWIPLYLCNHQCSWASSISLFLRACWYSCFLASSLKKRKKPTGHKAFSLYLVALFPLLTSWAKQGSPSAIAVALTHTRACANVYLYYLHRVNSFKQKKLKAIHLGAIYNLYSLVAQSIIPSQLFISEAIEYFGVRLEYICLLLLFLMLILFAWGILATSLHYLTKLFWFKKKGKNPIHTQPTTTASWEICLIIIYSQSYCYSTWSFQPHPS